MAEPRCATTAAARQPVKLSTPGSAGAMATSHCSWQAVVLKASIPQLPGKPDCLDWTLELTGDEVRVAAQPAIAPARSHR